MNRIIINQQEGQRPMVNKRINIIKSRKLSIIKRVLVLCIIFSLISCKSFENRFNQLVKIEEPDFLDSVDLYGPTDSKLYMALYSEGKKNNQVLLQKAISTNKTNWYIRHIHIQLTDGDVALCLLLDINFISDSDFYELIPDFLIEEYKGNSARVWWDWVQSDINNRKWLVSKLASKLM